MESKWVVAWLPWCLLACGGEVRVEPSDGAGGSETTSAGSSGGDSVGGSVGDGGTGGIPISVDTFCDAACSQSAEAGCFDSSTCLAKCTAESTSWSDKSRDAFVDCAQTDPLCFITIEGCMLDFLYDPDAPPTFLVEGNGFQGFEGVPVHLFIEGALDEDFVQNGAFSFQMPANVQPFDQGGLPALVYIDQNLSQTCEPGADWTASESLTWNGDFDDPVYLVQMEPASLGDEWVCDYF